MYAPACWWPLHLQNVFIGTGTARRRGRKMCSLTHPLFTQSQVLAAGQAASTLKTPLLQYSWRQCRLIVLPSIKNYYNTHFIGLSQGLFNISEELWRRNSGYCSEYHSIWKDLTWILHDHACVTVAAPIYYFSPQKKPHRSSFTLGNTLVRNVFWFAR